MVEINYKTVFFCFTSALVGSMISLHKGIQIGAKIGYDEGFKKGIGQRVPKDPSQAGQIGGVRYV